MCEHCDYDTLLKGHGITPTPRRLRTLEILGTSPRPLSAEEILDALQTRGRVNKVTVYRILDLLVDQGLVDRLRAGSHPCRYGLAPNAHHPRHPHFYCRRCGRMVCLAPETIDVDVHAPQESGVGNVEKVGVLLEGLCQACGRDTGHS